MQPNRVATGGKPATGAEPRPAPAEAIKPASDADESALLRKLRESLDSAAEAFWRDCPFGAIRSRQAQMDADGDCTVVVDVFFRDTDDRPATSCYGFATAKQATDAKLPTVLLAEDRATVRALTRLGYWSVDRYVRRSAAPRCAEHRAERGQRLTERAIQHEPATAPAPKAVGGPGWAVSWHDAEGAWSCMALLPNGKYCDGRLADETDAAGVKRTPEALLRRARSATGGALPDWACLCNRHLDEFVRHVTAR